LILTISSLKRLDKNNGVLSSVGRIPDTLCLDTAVESNQVGRHRQWLQCSGGAFGQRAHSRVG
jgi:hypothetical protein